MEIRVIGKRLGSSDLFAWCSTQCVILFSRNKFLIEIEEFVIYVVKVIGYEYYRGYIIFKDNNLWNENIILPSLCRYENLRNIPGKVHV